MKKSLLVLALSAVVGSASAYDVTVVNKSDFDVRAEMWFGGPGICGKKSMNVSANDTGNYRTGGCCLEEIRFTTTDYKGEGDTQVGKQVTAQGRLTGLGLSCRDNKFRVSVSRRGEITVENM